MSMSFVGNAALPSKFLYSQYYRFLLWGRGGIMIAISYRREDSLPIAGRLYDRLEAKFGKQNVFMDFDSIRPGSDFRQQIKNRIEQCKVMIAMIGPNCNGKQRGGD